MSTPALLQWLLLQDPRQFDKIIVDLRKEKGRSRVMTGKYERGEAVSSTDTAKKIAAAFIFYTPLPGVVTSGITGNQLINFSYMGCMNVPCITQYPQFFTASV
jgi:hypothetical protein